MSYPEVRLPFFMAILVIACQSMPSHSAAQRRTRTSSVQKSTKTVSFLDTLTKEEKAQLDALKPAPKAYIEDRLRNSLEVNRLSVNSYEKLRSGQIGYLVRNSTEYTYSLNQVLDDRNALIYGNKIWIEGINTADLVDDSVISLRGVVFVVAGTKRYTTVTGATRTVKHLAVLDTTKADQIFNKLLETRGFRVWTDNKGKTQMARLLRRSGGKVYLKLPNGTRLSLRLKELSKQDQEWTLKEAGRKRSATP